MYLGQIALRKNQSTKAFHLLETAIKLKSKNRKKIQRDLKSLYEKEIISFLGERSEKEIKLQNIIDSQLDKIKNLRRQNSDLQRMNTGLSSKVGQINPNPPPIFLYTPSK